MYQDVFGYSFEIGIRDGIYSVPEGTYESGGLIFLGTVINTIDITVKASGSGTWANSNNLRIELRHFSRDYVYWSAVGPFSSDQPLHVHLDFPKPIGGYEVRLTAVPEASFLLHCSLDLDYLCVDIGEDELSR